MTQAEPAGSRCPSGLCGAMTCALLMAACAGPQSPASRVEAAAGPSATAPRAAASGRAAFERTMLQRALDAERQGRLADAVWAWDALAVAPPERSDAPTQSLRLRGLMQTRATQAWAQAQQERLRGELDRAMRGYLLVLSLMPDHAGAAEALRTLERERNERQFLGRFSRLTITRGTPSLVEARGSGDDSAAPDVRNLAEHATMLAEQGEIDGAITTLAPAALARGADPALRRLLAEMYFKRAESLPPQPAAAVLTALRECLRLNPGHTAAASRLKLLAVPR